MFSNCLKFHSPNAREITYNNFEISFVVFMPNITTNHAITYTKTILCCVQLSNKRRLRISTAFED